MNTIGKVLVAGLGIFGISKLFAAVQAKTVNDELVINILNPRITKADPNPFSGGLEIGFDIQLQNPTTGSLKVTQPYMQILSGKSAIAQTAISHKEFTLKPLSELSLDPFKFKLGWLTIIRTIMSKKYGMPEGLTMLQKVSWLVSNFKQVVKALDLSVKYSNYANGLFFSDVEKITE